MNSLLDEFTKTLKFPELPVGICKAAGVLAEPIPGCDERFCIAVVGFLPDRSHGAKVTVNPRISRALLGGDLAKSLASMAELCCQDFLKSDNKVIKSKKWQPPFNGISLTKWREFNANDAQALFSQAALMFSTLSHSGDPTEAVDKEYRGPQVSEEDNFKLGVKNAVLRQAPELAKHFDNRLGANPSGFCHLDVDYLSESLTACFSTINPKASRKSLLYRHRSALWRVARARDFSLFPSVNAELIVWRPEIGLPIYSLNEYEIVEEVTHELQYEAAKENIQIIPHFREELAAAHLLRHEREPVRAGTNGPA
jgi:hypothetical protein